ncbi:MAG: hypothetical protein ABH807_03290 [Candidatus Shapirobacteria bacterium]
MSLNKLSRQALFLAIFTLITVMLWITVTVYLAATQSTLSPATAEQIAPFDPALKTDLITALKDTL